MAAWPFGLYGTTLRRARELAERDVSMRSWLAVSKWVDDAAPFPGETFRRWVGALYQRNELVNGGMELRGNRVDLSNIRCALLNVSGKWDYVVPPCQTRATTTLASGPDQESVSLNAGHVGMLVGPAAVGEASGPVSEPGSRRAREEERPNPTSNRPEVVLTDLLRCRVLRVAAALGDDEVYRDVVVVAGHLGDHLGLEGPGDEGCVVWHAAG